MQTQCDDVTEDLPVELYPFLASVSETSQAEPGTETLLHEPSLSASESEAETEDANDDVTVVELFKKHSETQKPEPVRFYHYLLPAYSPPPLWIDAKRYLREVRRRMIESREYDRIQYPNSLYQKLCRLARKGYQHVKTNLSS